MKRLLFLCFSLIFVECHSSGSISISSDHLSVRDRLVLELRVKAPESYRLDLESVDEALEGLAPYFTVDSKRVEEPVLLEGGGSEQLLSFVLEPWEAGDGAVALFSLRLLSIEGGRPILFDTERLPVQIDLPGDWAGDEGIVLDPLPLGARERPAMSRLNREQLEGDLREGLALSRHRFERGRSMVRFFLLVFALFLLLLLGRWIWRRFSSRARPLLDRVDPRGAALARLERLEAEGLLGRGLVELYYVGLAEIVRVYLEEAFQVRAPERTTQEFLEELVQLPRFDLQVRELLRAFLFEADLVKFARFEPSEEQCAAAVAAARQLILWDSSEVKLAVQ